MRQLSTVSVGRAYELLVLAVLRRYSFTLFHSGRPGDRGADFVGYWTLTSATRADIVGQCKCHRSPLTPGDVREFESVVRRMSCGPPLSVTGLLASFSGFSGQAMQTGMNSELPLILTQIRPLSPDDDDITGSQNDIIPAGNQSTGQGGSGYIRDFVLNHKAHTIYPSVRVVWRHEVEGRGGRKWVDIHTS